MNYEGQVEKYGENCDIRRFIAEGVSPWKHFMVRNVPFYYSLCNPSSSELYKGVKENGKGLYSYMNSQLIST